MGGDVFNCYWMNDEIKWGIFWEKNKVSFENFKLEGWVVYVKEEVEYKGGICFGVLGKK